jgi:truncated hemoglobin YjbI
MSNIDPTLYERIGGKTAVETMIDILYARMQDDYRLNRFFNSIEQPEQIAALKAVVIALLNGATRNDEQFTALLEHFFLTAFARDKRKSFVGGNDWGFFGYIIEQDHPSTNYLCDSHSHLLKFMPEDFHYDAVMEHLAATLQQMSVNTALMSEVLAVAEQGRNPVLGR